MKIFLALVVTSLVLLSTHSHSNDAFKVVEDNLRKINNGAFASAPIKVLGEVGEPGFEDFYFVSLGGQQIIVSSSGEYAITGDLINLDSRT